MSIAKRVIAAGEWLLILPGSLFMAALFMRSAQPTQYEPSHSAQRLIDWFSARPHLGLDVALIALPLTALVIGCAVLMRSWSSEGELRRTVAAVRAQLATVIIAGATLVAGGILAIVGLHMITD